MNPITKSKTMIGAGVGTFFGAIAFLSSPALHGQAAECLKIFGQNQMAQALVNLSPLLAMAGSAFAAYGHSVSREPVYTPKFVPFGPNKPEDIPEKW
jgi:hypothetical protein